MLCQLDRAFMDFEYDKNFMLLIQKYSLGNEWL